MSRFRWPAFACAVILVAFVATTAEARDQANPYTVHPLVSDGTSAPSSDANLVNGWGLSDGPTTPWWASNNGTSTSTLYSGTGSKVPLTVTVTGGPTGTVFNANAADFTISQNGKSGAARFLFATEAGTIVGWSPTVNGTPPSRAPTARAEAPSTRDSRPRTTGCTPRTFTTRGSTSSMRRSPW